MHPETQVQNGSKIMEVGGCGYRDLTRYPPLMAMHDLGPCPYHPMTHDS